MAIINTLRIPSFVGWTAYTPVIPKLYWDVYSQEERIKRICMEYDKLTHYASMLAQNLNTLSAEIDATLKEFQDNVNKQLDDQNKNITDQLAAQDEAIKKAVDDLNAQIEEQNNHIEELIAQQDANIKAQIEAQNEKIEAQLNEQNDKFNSFIDGLTDYIDSKFTEFAQGKLVYDVTTGTYRPSIETMRRLYQALAYGFKADTALVSEVAKSTVQELGEKTVYNTAWGNADTITIDDQYINLEV